MPNFVCKNCGAAINNAVPWNRSSTGRVTWTGRCKSCGYTHRWHVTVWDREYVMLAALVPPTDAVLRRIRGRRGT